MISLPKDLSGAVGAGATLLVPSRQHAERVRLAQAAGVLASGRRTWNTPDVLTVEAWLSRELERRTTAGERLPRLLTAAESWLLWRQATEHLTRDIEELLGRGQLADALSRSSQLAADYSIDVASVADSGGTETRLLADAERIVHAKSHALAAASLPQIKSSNRCVGSASPVVLAGFLHVSPYLRRLAEARSRLGYETQIRRAGGRDTNDQRVVLAADTSEEMERIALWCQQQLAGGGDRRLLIVAPGSAAARERLASLIRQCLDPGQVLASQAGDSSTGPLVSIEGGEPLARAPIVSHALTALAWLSSGCEFEQWSEWLRGPYWRTPDLATRSRIDRLVRKKSPLDIDVRILLGLLSNASLKPLAREFSDLVRRAAAPLDVRTGSPREWSERFRNALELLGWPGEHVLSSDEQQTVMRFTELLDEFGELVTQLRSVSRADAVRWLAELAGRTAFRPAAGDALVTLTSQFADPLACYDGIWVSGLHADAWPPPAQADPFLPLAAQLSAGVPQASAAGQSALAEELMSAWRCASSELVLSAPLRVDDVEVAPAPALRQWRADREPLKRTVWLPARLRREGVLEKINDENGTEWPVEILIPSGTRAVELQNTCPFRAYAEIRLGCEELEAPQPGVPPTDRGKLLHAALEKLWKQIGSSDVLQRMSADALDELIAQCVRAAAQDTLGASGETGRDPVGEREQTRAQKLIRALCDLERTRTPFRVRQTEFAQTVPIAGASLSVRIDRIDELAGGGLAILDYKSGRATPFDWYGERPSHPQLLTYLAAVGEATAAMATVAVTATEVRFSGVAASSDLLPQVRTVEGEWQERQREWTARVEQLVRDFLKGRAVVDPTPKACMFCRVIGLCRIAERKDYAAETPDE